MSDPTRESIDRAIGGVLFNVRNFPEAAQSRLAGQDMAPLREKLTDAVVAALPERDSELPLVYHVCGFVGDERPRIKVTTYQGSLHEVATDVLAVVDGQGYTVTRSTLRTLDGYLVEVNATVVVDADHTMWHTFTASLDAPWPVVAPETPVAL